MKLKPRDESTPSPAPRTRPDRIHRKFAERVRVSVVVPSADGDRGGSVSSLLEALEKQTFREMEAIVVIGVSPQGKAINQGVAESSGDILVILDDDSELTATDTIANLVGVLEHDPDIGMVGASIVPPAKANGIQRAAAREFPRFAMPIVNEVTDSDMPCHGCCAISRTLFEAIGGEREDIVRGLDPVLRRRIREQGRRVVLAPNTTVTHPLPDSIEGLARMFYRNGRGSAYAQRHNPDIVFDTDEDPAWNGNALRRPFRRRVLDYPLRWLRRLLGGRPIRALGDIVYAAGYMHEWLAGERTPTGNLRIVFAIPELSIGGSERQLAILARELQGRGHAVRILAYRVAQRPLNGVDDLDVRVLELPSAHHPKALVCFWKEIREFRPHVLHTFLFGFDFWPNVAARLWRVGAVVSSRRQLATWRSRRHLTWQRMGNRFVDTVVANSLAAADYACLTERGIHRGMVHVVPNAVAGPSASVENTRLPEAAGSCLVCVANFWPGKGQALLLEAFRRVRGRFPDAGLWFVGEGREQAGVAQRAKELSLTDAVQFLGTRRDTAAILSRADLLVHPSLGESSPNAILEAMAARVPVVAFAAGGVPEMLLGGDAGYLVPTGDVDALAHTIQRALENGEATQSKVARAFRETQGRTPAALADTHERIYRRTMRRPRPGESVALYTAGDMQSPSTRYRIAQYIPALQADGMRVHHFCLRKPGAGRIAASWGLLRHWWWRECQLRGGKRCGAVVLQKELTPARWYGPYPAALRMRRRMIYDFDDLVMGEFPIQLPEPLRARQDPDQPGRLCEAAYRVIAGNEFLKRRTPGDPRRVTVMPTVIDCTRYWDTGETHPPDDDRPFRIVWTGQRSTLPYLLERMQALRLFAEKAADRRVELRIMCDAFDALDAEGWAPLRIERIRWELASEISELARADAGIMPLPDNEWTQGKCGFKLLQYMGLGLPAVASPVGVNTDIVDDGVNGFLADDDDEWAAKLLRLAGDPALRRELGTRARETVRERFSLQIHAPHFVELVREVLDIGRPVVADT